MGNNGQIVHTMPQIDTHAYTQTQTRLDTYIQTFIYLKEYTNTRTTHRWTRERETHTHIHTHTDTHTHTFNECKLYDLNVRVILIKIILSYFKLEMMLFNLSLKAF